MPGTAASLLEGRPEHREISLVADEPSQVVCGLLIIQMHRRVRCAGAHCYNGPVLDRRHRRESRDEAQPAIRWLPIHRSSAISFPLAVEPVHATGQGSARSAPLLRLITSSRVARSIRMSAMSLWNIATSQG